MFVFSAESGLCLRKHLFPLFFDAHAFCSLSFVVLQTRFRRLLAVMSVMFYLPQLLLSVFVASLHYAEIPCEPEESIAVLSKEDWIIVYSLILSLIQILAFIGFCCRKRDVRYPFVFGLSLQCERHGFNLCILLFMLQLSLVNLCNLLVFNFLGSMFSNTTCTLYLYSRPRHFRIYLGQCFYCCANQGVCSTAVPFRPKLRDADSIAETEEHPILSPDSHVQMEYSVHEAADNNHDIDGRGAFRALAVTDSTQPKRLNPDDVCPVLTYHSEVAALISSSKGKGQRPTIDGYRVHVPRCAICELPFEEGMEYRLLVECQHVFCKACIDR